MKKKKHRICPLEKQYTIVWDVVIDSNYDFQVPVYLLGLLLEGKDSNLGALTPNHGNLYPRLQEQVPSLLHWAHWGPRQRQEGHRLCLQHRLIYTRVFIIHGCHLIYLLLRDRSQWDINLPRTHWLDRSSWFPQVCINSKHCHSSS